MFISIYKLPLRRGQTDEACDPSKDQCSLGNRGASDGKVFSVLHNSARLLSARDTPGQRRQQFFAELKDKCGHEAHQGSTPRGTDRLSVAK